VFRRLTIHALVATCALALAPVASAAQNAGAAPDQQFFSEGDLKLESGQVIKNFRISFSTHGTLNADKSNAVLMTSSLGGNRHRIDFLIGPGKAYDPARYFIICTDAIGNGQSTSPSNSVEQHGTSFPRFTIRDMVESEYNLVTKRFGIEHLAVVTGASMGGMQSLQWAVSHPTMMDRVVAITPLAHTPAWTREVTQAARMALMLDPAYEGGHYTKQPEAGWRLQAALFNGLIIRTPLGMDTMFPNAADALAFQRKQEDDQIASHFDANDWIWQSYAYDSHNVGDTTGFHGDYKVALASIKAKTIILQAGLDLLNPADEGQAAAKLIPGAIHVTIPSAQGHMAASAFASADSEFLNRTISEFLAGRPIANS
jgi:homoserine O-acetyltransferase/O-succinyltransferase